MKLGWGPEVMDLEEALAAQVHERRVITGLRRRLRLHTALLLAAGTALVGAAGIAIGLGQYARAGLIVAALALVLHRWVVVQRMSDPAYRQKLAARTFARNEGFRPSALPVELEIGDDGLRMSSQRGARSYPWTEVGGAVETARAVVVMVRARVGPWRVRAGLTIPKRALSSEAELVELRALIEHHLRTPILDVRHGTPAR